MAATASLVLDRSAERSLLQTELIPRPEYPQPQFRRNDWINLNGAWEFEFDDSNAGVDENWAITGHPFGRSILVPFCFESPLSGIGDHGFHPYVWYRRAFDNPQEWKGRRVLMNFGAVDYKATVWINGRFAGEHTGGHTPFRFDITPLLVAGQNSVCVRVEDPPGDRYIPRGKQHWEPESASIFYTRTTGIWQTVWLEATGHSYLERVKVDATMDGAVTFDARISRTSEDLQLFATIACKGKAIAVSMAQTAGSAATVAALVRDPLLWSPESPNLYEVAYELRRGAEVVDRVDSYFGFRTVSV